MLPCRPSSGLVPGWQFVPATAATAAIGCEPQAEEWQNSALFNRLTQLPRRRQRGVGQHCNPLIFSDYRIAAPLVETPHSVSWGSLYWKQSPNQGAKTRWPTQTHGSMSPPTRRTNARARAYSTPGFERWMSAPQVTAGRSTCDSPQRRVGPARRERAASVLGSRPGAFRRESAHA